MELMDGVVRLRPLGAADAPAIVQACNDPDTARFIPGMPSPYSSSHARGYLESVGGFDPNERVALAIADATTDDLLGAIEVRLGEAGSIGYWVAPSARGRSVATRALVLLSRWAIHERGVERLELTTHPDNVASQRVAEKAGFVREGVLRAHIRFGEGRRDSVIFSLLPRDLATPGRAPAAVEPARRPAGG